MKWNVYIVECADGALYTGISSDITRRIRQHNEDDTLGSRFVRARRPARLVYCEEFQTRSSALKRENEIKGWSRKRKLSLILGQVEVKRPPGPERILLG